jgi:hypothetical protein
MMDRMEQSMTRTTYEFMQYMCLFFEYVFSTLLFVFESEKIRFQIQNQIQKTLFLILKNLNHGRQITSNRHG